MKIKILVLVFSLAFSICCASQSSRVQTYLDSHPNLKPEIRQAIIDGDILIGMTTEQVVASIGKPVKINKTTDKDGVSEQWIYAGKIRLSYRDNRTVKEYAYVYFRNGRVSSWQSE